MTVAVYGQARGNHRAITRRRANERRPRGIRTEYFLEVPLDRPLFACNLVSALYGAPLARLAITPRACRCGKYYVSTSQSHRFLRVTAFSRRVNCLYRRSVFERSSIFARKQIINKIAKINECLN